MFAINTENLKYRGYHFQKYNVKKTLDLCTVYSKFAHKYKKVFKEEESIEILKFLGLITNIEEYQKKYNHV